MYMLVCAIMRERKAGVVGVRTEAVQGDAGVVDHEVNSIGVRFF